MNPRTVFFRAGLFLMAALLLRFLIDFLTSRT
jgi:hypothetical protein